MEKKNYVPLIIGLIILAIEASVVILPLVSCVASCEKRRAEERELMRVRAAQAEINAAAYIEKKYGFEAEVLDSRCDYDRGIVGGSARKMCVVTMKYDRKFYVAISGAEETSDGYDSYQYDEIAKAVTDRARGVIQGGSYTFHCGSREPYLSNIDSEIRKETGDSFEFLMEKYDGGSLRKFFSGEVYSPSLTISAADADISDSGLGKRMAEAFPDIDMNVSITRKTGENTIENRSFYISEGTAKNDIYEKKSTSTNNER